MGSSSGGGVPPGFRFHPTDEELLHYYLRKKISFQKFDMEVVREVDLNKMEPWDLQERCRIGSTPQNEWYFFSHKDRKYPTGSRTNRATNAGFWKATGRDKCIRNTYKKIGMRKTLVFYRGRAPHGQKTDWIMHEYRLEDGDDPQENSSEDGWVVCRVFKKKNLFKVVNEGGTSTNSSDHQQTNNNYNHQARSFMHHHLLRQQEPPVDLGLHYMPPGPAPPQGHYSLFPQSQPFRPLGVGAGVGYDYPVSVSDPSPLVVKQLMSRDCDSGGSESLRYQASELELEVGTCEAPAQQQGMGEWAMLDRLVMTSHMGNEDSSGNADGSNTTSHQQINQLSLRGEMDFWSGYGK